MNWPLRFIPSSTFLVAALLLAGVSHVADAEEPPTRQSSDGDSISVEVRVVRPSGESDEQPVAEQTVILQATRPVGPFERERPEPREEWQAQTDADGVARFELPGEWLDKQIELQAVTTHLSVPFRSGRTSPKSNISLELPVYDKGGGREDVVVERIRTVVEPWEDYLVVNQFWELKTTGNRLVDTTKLDTGESTVGLPLELPTDAEGIRVSGAGESEAVEGTIFWRGVLRPNQTTSIRARFSLSISRPTYVYRQSVDYPVENVEVVVPLQPSRIPIERLDDAALAAKAFESVEVTANVPGLRRNNEYLYARGRSLRAGDSFAFKLEGMPYPRPAGPWVALGLGLVGVLLVAGFARRDIELFESDEGRSEAIRELERQKERLTDELAELERAHESGEIDEIDYETEILRLREKLAVVLRRLADLRGKDEPPAEEDD